MSEFNTLGLAKPILSTLEKLGIETPTPIQARLIPEVLNGEDVVGIAQTGTGKTAAYLLPLLHGIENFKPRLVPKSCTVLVMVPTRELAAQVAESIRTFSKGIRVSYTSMTGGVKVMPQARAMFKGVDILVATPGRLEDHMGSGAVHLNGCTAVVLDEADQMLDLGFFPAITRILNKIDNDRQTILMSATMPPKIRDLASRFLNDPKEIAVARQSTPIKAIEQSLVHVLGAKKRGLLAEKIKELDVNSAIVFVRTKRGCDRVAQFLEKQDIPAVAIHGDRSQGQRVKALADFKKGRAKVMVATDIAARGLDIDGVSHVFNYELPATPEAYVHRIGRTARAGTEGAAISFCDPTERDQLWAIQKLIDMEIPVDGDPIGVDLPTEKKAPRRGTKSGRATNGRGGAPKQRRPRAAEGEGFDPHAEDQGPSGKSKRFKRRVEDRDRNRERKKAEKDEKFGKRPAGRDGRDSAGARHEDRRNDNRQEVGYKGKRRSDNRSGSDRKPEFESKPGDERSDKPWERARAHNTKRQRDGNEDRSASRRQNSRGAEGQSAGPRSAGPRSTGARSAGPRSGGRGADRASDSSFRREDSSRGQRPAQKGPRSDQPQGGERPRRRKVT